MLNTQVNVWPDEKQQNIRALPLNASTSNSSRMWFCCVCSCMRVCVGMCMYGFVCVCMCVCVPFVLHIEQPKHQCTALINSTSMYQTSAVLLFRTLQSNILHINVHSQCTPAFIHVRIHIHSYIYSYSYSYTYSNTYSYTYSFTMHTCTHTRRQMIKKFSSKGVVSACQSWLLTYSRYLTPLPLPPF